MRVINERLLVLVALGLLGGCKILDVASPEPAIESKVEQRLQRQEGVSLQKWAQGQSRTLEQSLAERKRKPLDLSLPPTLPSLRPDMEGDEEEIRPRKRERQGKDNRWPLTIADARAMALANNLDLKIAVLEPDIAATRVSEEEAKFDQLIFVNAKYGRKDTPLYDGDLVKFSTLDKNSPLYGAEAKLSALPQETKSYGIEAGISVPLLTGGKVTLSSPLVHKRTYKGVTSDEFRSALRFSISQPLLRGAGIANNVAGIRIAAYQKRAADVGLRLQSIRVLAAIDRAYWALYAAWGELDVRRQQYQNAADNLSMVRRRVDEGLTAAVELNRAEIGVAERMEKLVVAQTKLKLSQRKLKLLLNDRRLDLDSQQWLAPQTPPLLTGFSFDRERLARQALQGRLELLELELKLAADTSKIDYLRNQTLPLFMLDYQYGALGRDTAFGDAYGDAVSGDFQDWSIGLKFELPVSNALRESRLQRAVQQRLQRLTTKRLRELSIRREIFDALDRVDQDWQRIVVTRQNVILAGLNYQAELKQFRQGLRTMTEVLEMLTKLGEAQVREVNAIANYQVSLIDLTYATGTLLGFSKVGFSE
ncbi:TolC family protein [Methylomarinum vadi]|uniref:TolC family protein n=1 Tax=Methylomarinum vadi TaxID=438855 RepID=UPI00055B4514|nr:TolC family protein [Methylomarinum vadi]